MHLFYLSVPSEKRVHIHRNKGYNPDLEPAESVAHLTNWFLTEMCPRSSQSLRQSAYWKVHSAAQIVFTAASVQTLFHLFILTLFGMEKRWRQPLVDKTFSTLKTTIWDISCQPACSQNTTHRGFGFLFIIAYRRILAGHRIIISLQVCMHPEPVGISYVSNSLYIDWTYQSPKLPHLYPKLMSDVVSRLLLLSRY